MSCGNRQISNEKITDMHLSQSNAILSDYPQFAASAIFAEGLVKDATVGAHIAKFDAIAGACGYCDRRHVA